MQFYFDFISHNAYLAWVHLRRRDDAEQLEAVPVLFAGLLNHSGMLGPAELPAKRNWMLRNVLRKALAADIDLAPPASHPFNPLLALRVCHAQSDMPSRRKLVDRLFRAVWAQSLDISDPAILASLINDIGQNEVALLAGASAEPVKMALREATDQAWADGVFGVPMMRLGNELFWGYDDLPWLEACLAGQDPLQDFDFSGWQTVRPSAQRRR